MRSFYPVEGGEIVHKISEGVTVLLEKKFLQQEISDFRSPALQEFILSLDSPFDLSQAPLFRFYLIDAGENEHILLLWVHHIVMDGSSAGIFLQDLRELYENGGKYRAPADSPDYLDYAAWEAGHETTEESKKEDEEKKKFFLDMFADGVPENEMPAKPVRPARLPAASAREERRLNISALRKKAVKLGRTTFTLLFSAFGLTLGKYCNSGDVVLGLALGGRESFTSDMIGMFVNTLPVRVKFSLDENADEYIGRVAKTLKEIKARQS